MADEQLPSDDWLEQANAALASQGEIPKRRPLKALRMWAMETQQSLAFGSSAHTHITAWFERSTSYDRDARQPAGRSAFFWDLSFFTVRMPIPFGSPDFDPFSLFENTPLDVVNRIKGSEAFRKEFLDHFSNAFGISLSRLDLSPHFDVNPSITGQLVAAAFQQLASATSALLDSKPNPKSLQDARMAVEIALKAVITSKLGHTNDTLIRSFGHRLDKVHATLITVVPDPGFTLTELKVFPDIFARYSDNPVSPTTLWEGYALANRILAMAFAVIGDEIQSKR